MDDGRVKQRMSWMFSLVIVLILFVTWLWDHLVSNIDQYVLPPESKAEEVPKARPAKTERAGKNAPHNDTDPDSGRGMLEMSPKTLNSAIDRSDVEKSVRNKGRLYSEARRRKHSVSPESIGRRKWSCAEEPRQSEKSVPRGSIRLLQFAVRDAVASSMPSHSMSEPASKCLRSVVSSSIAETTYETHPQRPCSVAGVPNPMETSIRSVVEVSEDVKQKNKASGNVFDQLGRGVDEEESSRQVSTLMVDEFDDFNRIQEGAHEMDHLTNFYVGKYVGPMILMEGNSRLASYYPSDSRQVSTLMVDELDDFNRIQEGAHKVDHLTNFYAGKYVGPMTLMEGNSRLASYYASDSRQVSTLIVDEFDDFNRIQEGAHEMDHLTNFYVGKHIGPMTLMEGNSRLAFYYASDSERYDWGNVMSGGITNVSSVGTSGTEKHDGSMMQYSVADNAIKAKHPSHTRTPVSSDALASSSCKIVNISVNLNRWKPVHYQSSVGAKGSGAQNSMQLGDTVTGISRMTLLTGNSNFLKHAGKGNSAVEKQKSLHLFLVRFAATKDNLSRHFSKFGEVLKATILKNPATGQPKGSA